MSAETVLTSLIAVGGTLAGGGFTSWWTFRSARAQRRDQRAAQWRGELLTAVAELVSALDAHRAAMWVRETTRLSGAPVDTPAAVQQSHQTRAAVSAPLARVRILASDLAAAATTATKATYAMHDSPNVEFLNQQRQASIDAIAALETGASTLLRETP